MKIPFLGLKRQYANLKDELLEATDAALREGQLVNGLFTRSFEQWLCAKTGAKYAVTVHSGTQALEIIARAAKVSLSQRGPEYKVRLPNLTYIATLNAFLQAGYEVELVDTDKYGIMEVPDQYLSGHFTCVMGYGGRKPWSGHYYYSMTRTIVDGAQHWLECGGDTGYGMAISFDPTKNLPSSGNGGAIVTDHYDLYDFAMNYKDNCKFDHHAPGTNSKMSEQECAQLIVRTRYIDEWQARRKHIAQYYCERFRDLPIKCLSATDDPHAQHKFVVYTYDRNRLKTNLLLNGIESKVHYDYVLGDLQTARTMVKPDMLSMSVMLSRGVLSLPNYPELTDSEVEYITEKVIAHYN